jgi:hypothetical protein
MAGSFEQLVPVGALEEDEMGVRSSYHLDSHIATGGIDSAGSFLELGSCHAACAFHVDSRLLRDASCTT